MSADNLIARLRDTYAAWNNPPGDGLPEGAGIVLEAAATIASLKEERDRLVRESEVLEREYLAEVDRRRAAEASNAALRVALEQAHNLIANTVFEAGPALEWATAVDEEIQAALQDTGKEKAG